MINAAEAAVVFIGALQLVYWVKYISYSIPLFEIYSPIFQIQAKKLLILSGSQEPIAP